MRISIASYSFHGLLAEGKMNVFTYLESCRYRYGLDAADFWNGIIGTTDKDILCKVKQSLEEREMVVANYHVDGCHLWEGSAEQRAKHRQIALEHLHIAAYLGAQTVRFDTGGALETMTNEQSDYIIETYKEYAQFAHDHGFKVGPENHWGISLIADNMEQIVTGVASPAYGILMHIGHWEKGDADEGDRRMARWAIHTHVDARVTRNCLAEKIQLLQEAGYNGYWGVEHHSAKNEYAEVAYQLAEVRRVLSRQTWERQNTQSIEALQGKAGNPLLTLEQEGLA